MSPGNWDEPALTSNTTSTSEEVHWAYPGEGEETKATVLKKANIGKKELRRDLNFDIMFKAFCTILPIGFKIFDYKTT
jgi:hypothetical protein